MGGWGVSQVETAPSEPKRTPPVASVRRRREPVLGVAGAAEVAFGDGDDAVAAGVDQGFGERRRRRRAEGDGAVLDAAEALVAVIPHQTRRRRRRRAPAVLVGACPGDLKPAG